FIRDPTHVQYEIEQGGLAPGIHEDRIALTSDLTPLPAIFLIGIQNIVPTLLSVHHLLRFFSKFRFSDARQKNMNNSPLIGSLPSSFLTNPQRLSVPLRMSVKPR